MIDPTEKDIGRTVYYTPCHAKNDPEQREYGTITSFNDSFVFVRYGIGGTSAATSREDLEWN